MKKLTLLIALALLASSLASCAGGGADKPKASGSTGDANVTTTAAAEDRSMKDDLGSYDFAGGDFQLFSRNQTTPAFHGALNVEAETGDVLNDAIFSRNRRIEDRFNFVFKERVENVTDAARTAVLAGDDTYDMISTRCVYAYNYACEGLVVPIGKLTAIDLEKGYWDSKLTNEMSVLNKKYFAVGAFNLTSYDFTHMLLFNKEMSENYKLGDLYAIVNDGKWTFDKFGETAAKVTADLNGDGKMDASDNYGIVSAGKQIPPDFWIAAGELSVEKNSKDEPVFVMPKDERFFTVMEKIYNITWDNKAWMYDDSKANVPPAALEQFQNSKALFMDSTCFYIESLRAMDADFGILPFPKWDEKQEDYYSRIEGCELFCVPVTNKNPEMAGVILEALACDSAGAVLDVYYDVVLTAKYTRDEASGKMLDIIFANRVFDWGDTIWCPDIRDGIFDDMFVADDRDFASKIAALETTALKLIADTTSAFAALK